MESRIFLQRYKVEPGKVESVQQRGPWAWDYRGSRKKGCAVSKKERLTSGDQSRRSAYFTGSIFISRLLVLKLMSRGQNTRQECGSQICVWEKVLHVLRNRSYFDEHILPLLTSTAGI